MGNRFSVKKRKFQKISPSLCTPKFRAKKSFRSKFCGLALESRFRRLFLSRAMTRHTSPRPMLWNKVTNSICLKLFNVWPFAPRTRALGRSCSALFGAISYPETKNWKSTVKQPECTFLSFLLPSKLLVCVERVLCSYLKDDFFLQPSTNLLTSN